jgi:hypothetical protein
MRASFEYTKCVSGRKSALTNTQAPQTLFAIALQSPVTIVLRKPAVKVQAGCALYRAGQP